MGIHTHNNLPKGWTFRDTPSHGYLIPSYADNQNVPEFIRAREYEEDCAYSIPMVFNASLFTDEIANAMMETFKAWFPREYEKAFQITLQQGESYIKDKYYFEPNNNVGKYTPNCAWGDWYAGVPKGTTLVSAGRISSVTEPIMKQWRDDEKYFLIPSEEYRGGMFFDESQYPQTDLR